MGYYREKLAEHSAIWGDLYAVTMSQAFFSNGKHDLNTTFHAYIRKNPFDGGYLVTGGQNIINEWLSKHWKFDDRDIEMLREKTVLNPDTGKMERMFTDDFLDMLKDAKLELTIDAMPEGELAFPDEPIYRVHGPLWQCLMVEAAILNATNSQSLFATLASRLKTATKSATITSFNSDPDRTDPILEFGLRRAQCIGGLEPSRGAYLGGVDATSNNLAGKYYDIPISGTFAHALVMTYEDELEAFEDYAKAMPYNGIYLVDTYDTLEGVKKAVEACKKHNAKLKGIRLDSGDLAYLSKEARKILDKAGFKDAQIAASNDLDEATVISLKQQGARIDIWGIGTNLATSKAQPALGAVYKLGAVFNGELSQAEIEAVRDAARKGKATDSNFVRDVIKLSEQPEKVTIPGELDVLRYIQCDENGKPVAFMGDTIIENVSSEAVDNGKLARDVTSVRKKDDTRRKTFEEGTNVYRPLTRTFNEGSFVATPETVHDGRKRAAEQLAMLDETHKRLLNPHEYIVGIEEGLYEKRKAMIMNLRNKP